MGASSSTCSSSITTHGSGKYDLFLSFRGEDIRDKFISHFCDALSRKKIDFFVDDKLERGDEIWPALSEAIEGSRISVVMFSKNYASSKWCLRELVKILECKETSGQIVIPVFYEVDPSDVRKQTGSFEDAFIHHEKISEDEKQQWRAALTYASNLLGFVSSKIRLESKLVDEIINYISKKLKDGSPLNELSDLVGICSRIEQVISLLCIGKSDFEIVGIWGMGGIGKTTIAKAVLNQVSGQFEGNYFFANIREESEGCNGLIHLQEKVLSKILEEEYVNFGTPNISQYVKDKLKRKNVLIVLDDVNNYKQLETLAKGLDGFGPGSRIIITTRDKQILSNFGVTKIYEVKAFDNQEAHKLFCRYAFKQDIPPHKDFVLSVDKVIDYAKGNPLALKVVGSFLHQKTRREWESAMNKLNKISDPDIHNLLRISYDGLNIEEKEIFLDIAFSFKGHDKKSVIQILDACYFAAEYGLRVLIDKALINISYGKIGMHDLLQGLGYELVREESRNPGKRSRLHDHEDVWLVLRGNKGTDAVKSISLNMSRIKDIYIHPQVFEKMWNVRFLNFHNPSEYISKVHGPNYLPDELRYLCWDGYPSKALPSNLSIENLVELKLRGSSLERLWEGEMDAPNLKWLDLSKSQHLTRIPEFSNAPCMEAINLQGCEMLKHVSLNIFKLKSLRELYLDDCSNLEIFPEISEVMESLETLSLSGTAIKELPVSIENLNRLSKLWLKYCKMLNHVSPNIFKLKSLRELYLDGCSNLEIFPEIPEIMESLETLSLSGTAIKELPVSIENLNRLSKLWLKYCKMLNHVSPNIFKLKSLRELYLDGCSNLEIFPEIPEIMESLETLSLSGTAIKELSVSIENLNGLSKLWLKYCKMLKHVSPNIFKLKSLRELYLDGCSNLEIFPEIPEIMESLETLSLSGTAIKELSVSIENLNGLSQLWLRDCKNLEMLPSSICNLRCLSDLSISRCSKLNKLPENLGNLKSLRYLEVTETTICQPPSFLTFLEKLEMIDCEGLRGLTLPPMSGLLHSLTTLNLVYCNMIEIPEVIGCLSSLRELDISGNDFESLPKSIKQLSKLWLLKLFDCKMLQSLPELPLDLQLLQATNCKQLKSLPEASYFAEGLICSQTCRFWNCEMLNQKIIGNALRESLLLIQHQKRYQEEIDFEICLPGCDIPDWFNYKNFGSYLKIKIPANRKLLGFALCAVVNEHIHSTVDSSVYCEYHFGTKYCEEKWRIFLPTQNRWSIGQKEEIGNIDHFIFSYLDCTYYDIFQDFIPCSFEFKQNGGYEIKNCGVHPIFEEPIISPDKVGATNQDFVETSGSRKRVCDDHEAEVKPNPKRICRE